MEPVTDLNVTLRLGADWPGATATAMEPGGPEESLDVTWRDGVAAFCLDRLEVYKLVLLRPSRGSVP